MLHINYVLLMCMCLHCHNEIYLWLIWKTSIKLGLYTHFRNNLKGVFFISKPFSPPTGKWKWKLSSIFCIATDPCYRNVLDQLVLEQSVQKFGGLTETGDISMFAKPRHWNLCRGNYIRLKPTYYISLAHVFYYFHHPVSTQVDPHLF